MEQRCGAFQRAFVAIIALALVSGAGCTDSSSEARARPTKTVPVQGVPVLAGSTSGPNMPLKWGMHVVDGTYLLGAVLPVDPKVFWSEGSGSGWRADLLVTGDPVTVLTAYGQQLIDQGYAPIGTAGTDFGTVQLCRLDSCFLRLQPRAASKRYVDLRLSRAGPPVPQSLLTISWSTSGLGPTPILDWPVPAGEPVLPLPTSWPALPKPGQPIPNVPVGPYIPPLRLEPGSHQVLPADGVHESAGAFGHTILRIDGDPEEVSTRYAVQFLRLANDPAEVVTERIDDTTQRMTTRSVAGGFTCSIVVFSRSGEPSWAHVFIYEDA